MITDLTPVVDTDASTDTGLYAGVARDRNSGKVLVVLDERAALALRLILEDTSAYSSEIRDGSHGYAMDDAADVADTASLLHGLFRKARIGGY